ncbi:MAG: hypothetical protein WD052_11015 [Bacteroidales bacterium]
MKYPRSRWAKGRPGIMIPVFFLSIFCNTTGQGYFPDARSMALGNVSSISGSDGQHAQNPASLGNKESNYFAAGHIRPFLLKEIGVTSLEGILQASPGAFLVKISNYGITGYRIFQSDLVFGMNFSDKLSAGVSFSYYNTFTQDKWNYLWAVGPGAGLQYKLSAATALAVHLKNPVSFGNYSSFGPLLPSYISTGISHKVYSNTILLTEITYFAPDQLQFKTGIIYVADPSTFLRGGYHNNPHTLSFGSGHHFGNMVVDFALTLSSIPGITPAITLSYHPR